MTQDAFYRLEDRNFAEYIEKAIVAHKNWLANLERIVREKQSCHCRSMTGNVGLVISTMR